MKRKTKKTERKKLQDKRKKECDKAWSKKIHAMYGEKCFICGSKDRLAAHHIFTKKAHPNTRYDLENGVLLCIRCHFGIHSRTADPALYIKMCSKFSDNEFQNLRTRSKLNCKHDYEQVLQDLMSKE